MKWPLARLFPLLLLSLLAGQHAAPAPSRATPRPVHRVTIDGPISPAVADYLASAIKGAEAAHAPALVVQMDTPGGLLNSTKTIVKALLASKVPIIVYIAPGGAGATSAGVFITMAAHVAAMAPGTNIGAAHPVSGQGGDIEGDMREKVENYTASFVEAIAERRGRNVEWAVRAVRESVSITETEAVDQNVVDFIAADMDELLRQAHGREIELAGKTVVLDLNHARTETGQALVNDIERTLRQRVLSLVTDPNIAYLLMMAGMLGLYMEFSNPGAVFPGVVGAICLLLALLAGQVLPISSSGVLLILLGMAFLIGEMLMPSFGVLGMGGIVALTLGSLFLYTPESGLAVDIGYLVATIVMFATAVFLVLGLLVRDRRRQARTGSEGLMGALGTAVTTVHTAGKVKVHGELWNASSGQEIAKSQPVRVTAVDGLKLKVTEQTE